MSSRLKLVPRGSAVFTGTLRVAERPVQVGRDPRCEVVIPDPTVSRQHARLALDGEELVVEDLGSSGGT